MALNFSLDSLMEQSLLSDDPWWRYILDGAGWTVGLAVSAFLLALVLGIIVGTLRTSPVKIVRGALRSLDRTFPQHPVDWSRFSSGISSFLKLFPGTKTG